MFAPSTLNQKDLEKTKNPPTVYQWCKIHWELVPPGRIGVNFKVFEFIAKILTQTGISNGNYGSSPFIGDAYAEFWRIRRW